MAPFLKNKCTTTRDEDCRMFVSFEMGSRNGLGALVLLGFRALSWSVTQGGDPVGRLPRGWLISPRWSEVRSNSRGNCLPCRSRGQARR